MQILKCLGVQPLTVSTCSSIKIQAHQKNLIVNFVKRNIVCIAELNHMLDNLANNLKMIKKTNNFWNL